MSDQNIGFIGLGNVGSKLANSILFGNYNLFVYDLDKAKVINLVNKGAKFSSSISELLKTCSVFITCLPSPTTTKDIMESKDGVLDNINNRHLWIEMSTTDENEIIRYSKLFDKKNAQILEAPVTGGQHRAETGNIAILASGERKVFERALPLLKLIGYEILFCGKLGNASTLKVVTNYLASLNLLGLGEALMVCKKYGLDLATSYEGIRISSGNSFVHETESKVILNGSYDVGFTMELVHKDIGLFDKLTKKFKIPADISKLMYKIFSEGLNNYGKKSFSTSIIKRLEEKCNTDLRAPYFPNKLIDYENRKEGFEIKF